MCLTLRRFRSDKPYLTWSKTRYKVMVRAPDTRMADGPHYHSLYTNTPYRIGQTYQSERVWVWTGTSDHDCGFHVYVSRGAAERHTLLECEVVAVRVSGLTSRRAWLTVPPR